mmetsp:Transcript_104128/g.295009  ORF Transcript_104128/g.295009 Transcript_104128/m.295009 type:complete len:401 (-) Transcript_104128:697-1899(-)
MAPLRSGRGDHGKCGPREGPRPAITSGAPRAVGGVRGSGRGGPRPREAGDKKLGVRGPLDDLAVLALRAPGELLGLPQRGVQGPDDRVHAPGDGDDVLPDHLDVGVEDRDVEALRGALQPEAAEDELLAVDVARLVQVDEVEELAHLLHVEVQRAEVGRHVGLVHDALQLLEADLVGIVVVKLAEKLLHGVHELLLGAHLAVDDELPVVLRPLHGAVHEHCGNHVHHGEDREGHVEVEDELVDEGERGQRLQDVAPIISAGDRHVERCHRREEGPEVVPELFRRHVVHQTPVEAIRQRGLREENPEHQDDDHHHHHGPQEGPHGAAEGVDHDPKFAEKVQHVDSPCHTDNAHQAEDPEHGRIRNNRPEHRVRAVRVVHQGLQDRGQDDDDVEQVPAPVDG